jgi:hypothetical protein
MVYSKIIINDWFAFGTRSAWTGMTQFRVFIFEALPTSGIQGFLIEIFERWPFTFAWVPFILATPFLIYAVVKMEKSLAAYSIVYVLAVVLIGALDSVSRFLSFCFPLWLAAGLLIFKSRKSKFAVPIIFVLFSAISVYLWQNFLNGIFIA